ncbi:glycosyltransferase family 4 protein [Nostocoides vanveenii]|uniref:D-inositol 3-phosphate glycosyltransferase n=1 Tax=Nostocoides vanveenii TaxID=330835 RepID=A0ABN2K5N1_9MICO
MKIGFVTQWYPPETGTAVPRAIAQGLGILGHEVHVLTGIPNYPAGRVYEGYRVRPYSSELDGDVTVHRAPLYPDHSRSSARRMVNYLSFAVGASAVSLTTRFPTPEVWLTYSSPATAALPAMLPRRRQRPHAMIIQDLWPDSVLGSAMATGFVTRALGRPLAALSHATYRSADSIGVISPGMRDVLVGRGIQPDRILDTPNWVADQHTPSDDRQDLRHRLQLRDESKVFLYAGNFGEMQSLTTLIQAFDEASHADLVLIGDGMMRAEVERVAATRPNVHVLPPVPADDVPTLQAAADVLVVSLQDTPLMRVTMPSKLQSSMAAGKPILVQGAGDVAAVVERARCGAAGPPGSTELRRAVQGLASAEASALGEMARRARDWYEAHYSAASGAARVENLLIHAIEEHTR